MENATKLINEISGANIITCLDVLKRYQEIPLEGQSCDLPFFKFTVCNTATTFQKSIDNTTLCNNKYCKAYLDDIIFPCVWNTHLKHLDAVLSKLTEIKFTVNVQKCVFAKSNYIFRSSYRRR